MDDDQGLADEVNRVWRMVWVENTPRRPKIIMEGPLVSDTTELLSGAGSAPEGSPIGQAGSGGSAAAASRPQGRPVGDLSKLLVPDLQKIAHQLGIPGAGRMRKGQLVAAIEERQVGAPASATQQSATRGAPAGAGASRPLNQDAMEAGTSVRPGIGDAEQAGGIGDAPRAASTAASTAQAGIGDQVASVAPAAQDASAPAAAAPAATGGESPARDAVGGEPHGGDIQGDGHGDGQGEGRRDRRRNGRDRRDGGNRDGGSRDRDREPAAAGRGQAQPSQGGQGQGPAGGPGRQGSAAPDDDEDGQGRRRGRDRYRNRNRRRGERQGGEPETVIAEDDVLIPIAGILDLLENYAFVRTTGYLAGPNDVYVSLSQVR